MSVVTVKIDLTDAGWEVSWRIDTQPAGTPFTLPRVEASKLRDLPRLFDRLIDRTDARGRHPRPVVRAELLRDMGQTLFDAICTPAGADVVAAVRGSADLHVEATTSDVLNLPWELLPVGRDNRPLGTDPNRGLYRVTPTRPATHDTPSGGPLRVLFLAAAPTNQPQLNYEREEEEILKVFAAVPDVILLIAEMGSVEELQKRVRAFKPHVVHLSGHGEMPDGGTAVFCFEDEAGLTRKVNAPTLVQDVFDSAAVRCVFLNGCETSQAAVAGLCQAIVAAGVPLALGWAASVADDRATDFAVAFYRHLATGATVGAAAATARERIRKLGKADDGTDAQDVTFALPQLYAATPGAALYDPSKTEKFEGQKTQYRQLPGGVVGLVEGFIGRRREQQKFIPALRSGKTTVLILHGIGGQGKSTLATRIANRLEPAFRVLSVKFAKDPTETPEECAQRGVTSLLQELRLIFKEFKRQDWAEQLSDPNNNTEDRLLLAVSGLNEVPVLLVLDNFEDVMHLHSRAIADPNLQAFYARLLTHLTGKSRAIITTRLVPEVKPAPPSSPLVQVADNLGDFSCSDFLKFLRLDSQVEQRMRRGELLEEVLETLHTAVGGTPRFLDLLRKNLRTYDADKLSAELQAGAGMAQREREQYIEGILGGALFAALSADARLIATRLAVSLLPVPPEGIAAITGLPANRTAIAAREAAAFGLLQELTAPEKPPLYLPPGLLSGWLSHESRLPPADATATHLSLAGFWREVYEKDREAEMRVGVLEGLDACRRHARMGGDRLMAVWAANRIANPLIDVAEWRRARRVLDETLEGMSADDGEVARAWHNLGTIDMNEGKYTEARLKFDKALEIRQRIGDEAGAAANWHQLGSIDMNEGQYAEARLKFGKALEIKQRIGDVAGEAVTWHNLGSIDLREGKYAEARLKFGKSLEIMQQIGNVASEAATWHQLGSIDVEEGKYAEARLKFGKSLEIRQRIGDVAGEAATWHQLGTIDVHEGEYAEAREKFSKSLEIRQRIGDVAGEAATWHQLGSIDLREGKYAEARLKFGKALEIMQRIGDVAGEATTWHQLGSIDLREGKYAEARLKFGKALEIRQRIGDVAGEAATWAQLGNIDLEEAQYAEARLKFGKALEIMQRIGDVAGEASTWHQLGHLAWQIGRKAEGVHLIALCFLLDQSIGHGDTEADLRNLSAGCSQLGYSPEQVKEMLNATVESYRHDRGAALLRAAFPEE